MKKLAPFAFLAALFMASPAGATPDFPQKLADATGAPCVPQCTICHTDSVGGKGTVTKPFGKSMVDAGLISFDNASVAKAVNELLQAGTDSDGDGIGDIAEIRDGDDPNSATAAKACGPTYGCGARIEPKGPIDVGSALAALATALGLVLGRRRTRSARR
jgi:hypothetical protein